LGLLFIYIGLTLAVSFLCSILEATLLSATRQHIYAHHSKGLIYAKVWIQLKEDIDKPISAILSLNTIANTIGAIGVGSQVTVLWGSNFLGLASGVMTLLILIFSEIIPKTLGARYWRQILPYSGNLVRYLVFIMSPFVFFSNVVSKIISPMKKDSTMYREELHALASIGKDEGAFPDKEYRIISNLIHFNKILVKDIMTPRTVMFAVPQDMCLEEIYAHPDYMKFSRVPVYESNMDNMVGFILKSDLLNNIIKGNGKKTAKDILRPIYMTVESTPVPVLFEELLSRKEQISLVMDSYGGTSGVASLEDIIETLFGIEIMDELDSKRDMQVYARDKWKERAIKLGIIDKEIPKVER
jgi:CBS domain containing-hemolysin-like protein